MRVLLLAAVAASALLAQDARASTCTGSVVTGIDNPTGATFNCVNVQNNKTQAAYTAQGVPALDLTSVGGTIAGLLATPQIILTQPFGQALIRTIYLQITYSVNNKSSPNFPACVSTLSPTVSAKALADSCNAQCDGATPSYWYGACVAGNTKYSLTSPNDIPHGILDLATHVFALSFVYQLFTSVVPCLPATCATAAVNLCKEAGLTGKVPNNADFTADLQKSSFAALSAKVIQFGNQQVANITGWYARTDALGGVVSQVASGLPATLGGPFSATYTIPCSTVLGGTYGTGLGGSGDASGVQATIASAIAAVAGAALTA